MDNSSGSSTATITTANHSLEDSHHLSSSIPQRSPSKISSSEISTAYKYASQLFLTRRFSEALSAIEPAITPVKQPNGSSDGDVNVRWEAPIASSTVTQRIKVWVLYITLLNSIVDLGKDEGKRCFGQTRYREIVTRVRNGDIWETVVRDGYGGKEGSVDAKVVFNLATLLLSQAPSQIQNQSRLESYLASSSGLDLDVTPRSKWETSSEPQSHANGAGTPKDFSSHLKILELFTLHVLPKNEEWEYARSFISMSDVLDDERRDAFLQSLQELQDMREHEMHEEAATPGQARHARQEEAVQDSGKKEAKSAAPQNHTLEQSSSLQRRITSELDCGIDKNRPSSSAVPRAKKQQSATASAAASGGTVDGSRFPPPAGTPRHRNMRKSSTKQLPGCLWQARNLLRVLQRVVQDMVISIGANPSLLLKMLLSVLAIIMALSRRDVRDRARRIVSHGWDKIRNTAGMGLKVSYI